MNLRAVLGIVSLLAFTLALNMLVLRQDPFLPSVYVPLLAGFLFGVAWLILTLSRAQIAGLNAAVSSIVFLGICITLYAFAKRTDASWDLSQEGRQDLFPQTIQVLEDLPEDVYVTCFFVRSSDARTSLVQDKTLRFLERCQRYTDRLHVEVVDPQRYPERVQALNALRLRISGVGSVLIRSGTRHREIPLTDFMARLEERDFTNALLNVSRGARPKVYFLTGHGQRDIDSTHSEEGASDFREWLEKEAYEVAKTFIDPNDPSLPEDCDLLVVNGMQADFQFHDVHALDGYINRGGRLLVLMDPWMVQQSDLPAVEQFRPWLAKRLGIEVGSDILVSVATESIRTLFLSDFALLGKLSGGEAAEREGFRGSFNATHPITRTQELQLILTGVRSVMLTDQRPEDVTRTILIQSTPDTWAETNLAYFFASPEERQRMTLGPDPHEHQGPVPVAIAATVTTDIPVGAGSQMRDARVIVFGNASLATNTGIDDAANSNLLLNMVAWLTESEELIAIRPLAQDDQPVYLTRGEEQAIWWIAALGPVQFIAVTGIGVVLYRRRYR